MKKSLLWAALTAGLLTSLLAASSALAQQPQPQPRAAAQPAARPSGVALLDINAVFKEHPGFKARMAELEERGKQLDNQVKIGRDELKALAEQMKEMREGTPQFKQMEEQLAEKQGSLQVRVQLQKKEFLQMQAKVYQTVYQEIEQEVASIAAANNIAVVLRYSSDPVDAEKPDDVLRNINKQVVYAAAGLDITPYVCQRIKSRAVPGPAPAGYPGGNGTAHPGVPYNGQPR